MGVCRGKAVSEGMVNSWGGRNSMKRVLRFAFAVCLLMCIARPALSQNRNSGEIRGTVKDASGAAVAGATVTLENIDTGVKKVLVTNGDGFYDSVSTTAGTYKIGFEKAGFKKLEVGPIILQVDTITEDATMQVGAMTEEVTITAEAPLLETESGQQDTTLDSKALIELPQYGGGITGADWASFNIYLPGAGGTTNGRVSLASGAWNAGDAVSINGNLPNFSNF